MSLFLLDGLGASGGSAGSTGTGLTGSTLLTGLSRFLGDEWQPAGLATTANGTDDGATLVDSFVSAYGQDALQGFWIRITSGDAENEISRIISNQPVAGQIEVQPEFSVQITSGTS